MVSQKKCIKENPDVAAKRRNAVGCMKKADKFKYDLMCCAPDWSLCTPEFSVKDHNGDTVLKIEGPCMTFSFCGDVEFKVLTADGESEVGMITKQWSGLAKEYFTDSDNFGISFPMDLDVRCKATLLGALFLIDFMFFEKKNNESSDGVGMLS